MVVGRTEQESEERLGEGHGPSAGMASAKGMLGMAGALQEVKSSGGT